jgi:predicted ATPase/DNA-binding SARP family transcriptional activator
MTAVPDPPSVRVEVLGPLCLIVDGVFVDVRGPKRRAVLTMLAIAQGRTVTVDSLVDALWPSEAPESGRQALHSHVFRLRAQLGSAAARLQTRPDGYRLDLTAAELDLAQARTMMTAGRAGIAGDADAAVDLLRRARSLWRGPVLADLAELLPIGAAIAEWAQLHRDVTDALITAAIAAGRSEDVLSLAVDSVTADPLRESAALLLMRALAAAGQAAEALRIGREYRRHLAAETGLDPTAALDQLERDIAGGAAGPGPVRAQGPARPTTRIIGRETELAALRQLLGAQRLVTVVGPGGVGKTRLAQEVVQRGETATVSLAAVLEPAAIPHALAAALKVNVVQGDVLTACLAVLGDSQVLLLVDNCEHVLDAVRDTVEDVLSSCPRVVVLATSREPLGLPAENVLRLAPLTLPPVDLAGIATQYLARVPAVEVFLDRAARVRPGPALEPAELATVADIVRRLDGMPLAIELAVGRLSTFSLADLSSRLDRSLDLLGRRPGGDERHRTLRATIEWSYQLLTPDERRLFRHLAVFVDGVDLDTAERLAAELAPGQEPGAVVARLVDASMINAHFESGTRYRMLDTLRAYGLDRLTAAGEGDAAARLLLRWAVELIAWVDITMVTESEPEADAVLRRELPNLRAAWRLVRERRALDEAASIVTGLLDAVGYRDLVEVRHWALELAGDPLVETLPLAAAVLGTAAEAAYQQGDHTRAVQLARRGLEVATTDAGRWYCFTALSVVSLARGAFDEAVRHSLAAAERATRPRENLGLAALATAYAGDLESARALNDRGLAAAVSPTIRSWGRYVAGEIESAAGNPELAEEQYAGAIALARASGATFLVGVATVGLLSVRVAAGRIQEALTGYRDVVDYFAGTGNWTHQWATLRNLADLLRLLGADDPAAAVDAAMLDAAADAAPDAPADVRPRHQRARPVGPGPGRTEILDIARRAIDRHLGLG